MASYKPRLYVALTHYPVLNKNGDVIASAVTNLDLHDIARAGKTYGVKRFFVVTPLADQKALVDRIVRHWTEGFGGRYNALRKEALALIRIEDSLDSVKRHVAALGHGVPKFVATCARQTGNSIDYRRMKAKLKTGHPHVLVFGTAWGLAEAVLQAADYVLEPIGKGGDYNHLSVRSAVSIILDRLSFGG